MIPIIYMHQIRTNNLKHFNCVEIVSAKDDRLNQSTHATAEARSNTGKTNE